MFFKRLENGKYRYYEKYYDEVLGKWLQVSITMASKSRRIQAEAKYQLNQKIESRLVQSQKTKEIALKEKNNQYTVSEVYLEWQEIRKQELKDTSFGASLSLLRNFINKFGNQMIDEVTTAQLQKHFMSRKTAFSSKNIEKTAIKFIFEYGIRMGYLKENPILKVILPRQKKTIAQIEKAQQKFLTKEEMICYLDFARKNNANEDLLLMTEFIYLTGLRIGEVLALMWENIDFNNNVLHVKYTLDYVFASRADFKLTTPKTIYSIRQVMFTTRVKEILLYYKNRNKKMTLIDERFIFVSSDDCLPFSREQFAYFLRKFAKNNLLIDKPVEIFTPHMLRHSHISLLVELGLPIKSIMERVGHSDEKITIQIYTHVTEKMKNDVIDSLENIII
ncbi:MULTISPECIES: site-specific integrase [unclassified Enterococcus]|uniref:tyrosine-type recombinase/integrase n=1 Tax=unclassified Enterococcus TaxID=2608891 RepID=UPI0015539ABB|nr:MULTISPECIES: site-specific integrase [unclassified Enterococcus]MBS7576977.1 site-specific integrase [Enterococcus sp. MMGLQ5-2]MBS7584384.1 site-specific integrase [Enterococcus sp. MMGLQ5-1]NPD12239.1 site-specific integrase [Enterococcus sp. MMGLQ5-1]NPD36811.1 site-specific integrase [Enterococcus sp. MMGLQ5-2]